MEIDPSIIECNHKAVFRYVFPFVKILYQEVHWDYWVTIDNIFHTFLKSFLFYQQADVEEGISYTMEHQYSNLSIHNESFIEDKDSWIVEDYSNYKLDTFSEIKQFFSYL